MADKKIVKEWLAKANEDFYFASRNLDDTECTYYAQICFHYQQAAEKYLKAFIVLNDLKFVKTHDLVQLFRICSQKNIDKSIEEDCIFLTDFYIETRYPVHWPTDIDSDEAKKAKDAALKIKEVVAVILTI